MHTSAMKNCEEFRNTYMMSVKDINPDFSVVEIGSQDVNGSLRALWSNVPYTGVDFVNGKGVDLILDDPYTLPLESESCDIVLSSSCFEHSEMFWVLYLEIMRILKPHGLFYLNVPSNGDFHRWPVDCWRFYPDSGRGLVTWAKRNGMNPALLESYTSAQGAADKWNDYVAVFLKDEGFVQDYPGRILHDKQNITNGLVYGSNDFVKQSNMTEDQKRLNVIGQVVSRSINVV